MEDRNALREGILKTVAFFDGLDIALTDFELWQHGFMPVRKFSYTEVTKAVTRLCSDGRLAREYAFVVLPEGGRLVGERIRRGMLSEEKYRRAMHATRILRYVPFIRMVGICNTLAFDVANKESDIDVFIVSRTKRLYITYAIATGLMHIFRFRRWRLRVQNKICLSFYVSEAGLDMRRFELSGGDPYLAQWTKALFPLWRTRTFADAFTNKNQAWLANYFGDPQTIKPVARYQVADSVAARVMRGAGELLLTPFAPALETMLSLLEQWRLRRSLRRRMRSEPTGVVVDDRSLKFHEEDRRAFFRSHMNSHV